MRSISAIRFAIIVLTLTCTSSAAVGEPATKPAEQSDPDVVQWRLHCDLEDGRRFLTDGSLVLEARYVTNTPVPEKSIPPQGVLRLLESKTDHEFTLADLDRKEESGHFSAPGSIQINRKYIDLLRGSSLKATVRFRAKGSNDPILILDDQKVVGVMMPMKS